MWWFSCARSSHHGHTHGPRSVRSMTSVVACRSSSLGMGYVHVVWMRRIGKRSGSMLREEAKEEAAASQRNGLIYSDHSRQAKKPAMASIVLLPSCRCLSEPSRFFDISSADSSPMPPTIVRDLKQSKKSNN